MSFLSVLGQLTGVAGGLLGLKKKKDPTPASNLLSQAQGAREAADRYGFNPLTMLQFGQTGGAMSGGGAPPLASIDFLTNSLKGLDDELSGAAGRRREAEQLDLDLAKIKLEAAQTALVLDKLNASDAVGGSRSPLGNRAARVQQGAGTAFASRSGMSFDADGSARVGSPNPLVVAGVPIEKDLRYSDEADIEDRHGDFVGALYGLPVALADADATFRAKRLRDEGVPADLLSRPGFGKADFEHFAKTTHSFWGPGESHAGWAAKKFKGESYEHYTNRRAKPRPQVLIPGQSVNFHGATRNRAFGF